MKIEFIECYDDLFTEGFKNLQKVMLIKLYAMELCQRKLNEWMSIIDPNKGAIDYAIKMFTSRYIEGKTLYELQKEVKEAKKVGVNQRPSHISMFGKTKSK